MNIAFTIQLTEVYICSNKALSVHILATMRNELIESNATEDFSWKIASLKVTAIPIEFS